MNLSEAFVIPSMTVAFAVTVVSIVALRPVANSVRLLDRPGGRKSHVGDVPIIGGIAMFAGAFAGLTLVTDLGQYFPSFFVASLLLVIIGVVDDKYHIPPLARVVAQIATILIMFFGANLSLAELGNPLAMGEISLGPLTLIATIVVGLTVINAFNLVDGVDGLAGSLAIIAVLSIAVVGGVALPASTIALVFASVILGYLIFNFPVAWNRSVRAFMGDAGSTFLGFAVVYLALGVSQGADRIISPVYCLWFASIPIYDLLTCFVRRTLAGKSPFTPGRDHFHHTLARCGMDNCYVLAVMVGLQLIYATASLVGFFNGVPEPLMFAAWVALLLTQRMMIMAIAKQYRLWARHRKIHVAT